MFAEEFTLSTVSLNCTQNPQDVFKNVYIKRYYQMSKNATHRMGENTCKSHIWQGIKTSRVYRKLLKLNSYKNKLPDIKEKKSKGLK